MRKKIFAVIMSTMMMITFMPSMAFAAETNIEITNIVSNGIWSDVNHDTTKFVPNADGTVNLPGSCAVVTMHVKATDNGRYYLKAAAVPGVTYYAKNTSDNKWYEMTSAGLEVVLSGGGAAMEADLALATYVFGSKGVTDFDTVFTFGDVEKTIAYSVADAGFINGNKYYQTSNYAGVSADARTGDTIQVSGDSSSLTTLVAGDKAVTFDFSKATGATALTVGKGCTLKNANLSGNLTLEEGAAAENVKTSGQIKVTGKNVKVTSAEAGTIEVSGSAVFAGKLKTGNISVRPNSTADISRIAKDDLTFNGSAVTLVSADSKFIPNNDERWVKGTLSWTLDGVYVCNGKTYKTGNALWNEVSGSSSVAVKVIGEGSDNFTLAGNQTLTLDGISGSKFSGTVDTTSAGAKLVINSGIYANENLLAPSSDGYLNVKAGGKKGAWSAVKKIKTK